MSPPRPSLFVATPCYAGLAHAAYMRGLLALADVCAELGVGLKVDLGGGDALVSRARAAALEKFIGASASHLMFIDADIGFTPDQVLRLLGADRDLVGGLYRRKGPHQAALDYEPLQPPASPDPEGFQQVAAIGAGFLLVSKPAVERLCAAYPELRARLGDLHGRQAEATMLFEPMIAPDSTRYLADHEALCHRWRAIGGQVWADTRSSLQHISELALAS